MLGKAKNIAIIVIHSTIIKYSTHKQAGEDSIDAQLKYGEVLLKKRRRR
jgi:hypothetical protein